MKTKAGIITLIFALSGMVPAAFAAAGGREDHSSLVIWGFLGFCALIVVAQTLPAIRSALRASAAQRERAAAKTVKAPAEK